MRALAWAMVSDTEPKVHKIEQAIKHSLPGRLQKLEGYLEPARQRVEELKKLYDDQVQLPPALTHSAWMLVCCIPVIVEHETRVHEVYCTKLDASLELLHCTA